MNKLSFYEQRDTIFFEVIKVLNDNHLQGVTPGILIDYEGLGLLEVYYCNGHWEQKWHVKGTPTDFNNWIQGATNGERQNER